MSKYAYVIMHFGSNPTYLELELYFLAMLLNITTLDIVYMYSIKDTPTAFVKAVQKIVPQLKTIPFDDDGITYNVEYKSKYTHFNLLRVCDFIFAYTLTQYDKVCIIEADMVVTSSIDSIFDLQAPAALTYYTGLKRINQNFRITTRASDVLAKCNDMGRLNGGIMLIHPDMGAFHNYIAAIPAIVQKGCKYPNETLFEYVNRVYYNLPVMYNFSHYHLRRMHQYPLSAADIKVYHFNETTFKHLDIIKNPVDEKGVNWLDVMATSHDPKYALKWVPVSYYLETVYTPYHTKIEKLVSKAQTQTQTQTQTPTPAQLSPVSTVAPCKPGKCPTGEQCNRKTRKCKKMRSSAKTVKSNTKLKSAMEMIESEIEATNKGDATALKYKLLICKRMIQEKIGAFTTGRQDNDKPPYTNAQINAYIKKGAAKLIKSIDKMYDAYKKDGTLGDLDNAENDWFREFM